MNAIEFSTKFIYFNEQSPINGKFELKKYPFLGDPLLNLDNIRCKNHVVYKASAVLGTVFLQLATAYRLGIKRKSMLLVAQSDDDVEEFSKTRMRPFLERIPMIRDSVRNDKYAITIGMWQWADHYLVLTGPGKNAQQSKQVAYVHTDESHLYKAGTLAAFRDRMGGRWDRGALHATTSADEGTEVDELYYLGNQNEWHQSCPFCHGLIWPLWSDDAKREYNGHQIFIWDDSPNERDVLNSIRMACPHCDKEIHDEVYLREGLNEFAQYVSKNPGADPMYVSHRWNTFAASWRDWKDFLSIYLLAMKAAKMGDLGPWENWVKKQLCNSFRPELPDFGDGGIKRHYSLGQIWVPDEKPDTRLIMASDYQAGKKSEGSHLWTGIGQFDREGNARLVEWARLETWAQKRAMQLNYGIADNDVYVDCGWDNRTVYLECSRYGWYAVRGSDEPEFMHSIKGKHGTGNTLVRMPYSQTERANGNAGQKQPRRLAAHLQAGRLPPGWCLMIRKSNPQLYGYLYALATGNASGRNLELPDNAPETFTGGFPAFIPVIERDKKSGIIKMHWRQVKKFDHPWDVFQMLLIGAIRAGYFPLAELSKTNEGDESNLQNVEVDIASP